MTMKTRIDRFKVKRRMENVGIDTFEKLAEKAKLSPTTVYNALDGYNWRATTLDAIAAAIGCNPLDIVTVDAEADLPKVFALAGVVA
jgi:DNA-binding Xre family transcriptional regulator